MAVLIPWKNRQPTATHKLGRALAQNRLHHGTVFSTRNIELADQFSRAVAQSALCQNPSTELHSGCGVCLSCAQIKSGGHPDAISIIPNERNSIGIEPIRELNRRLSHKPSISHAHVILISRGDKMNPAAQNALLKTLEEPPGPAFFFITTTAYRSLLVTVRSRVQRIHLNSGSIELQLEHLKSIGIEQPNPVLARILELERDNLEEKYKQLEELDQKMNRFLKSPNSLELVTLASDLGGKTETSRLAFLLWCTKLRDNMATHFGASPIHSHGKTNVAATWKTNGSVYQATIDYQNRTRVNANRTLAWERILSHVIDPSRPS
ncbi:MAG: hypothetical protein VYA34_16705 [Myxococcota bacterium]|nr:hypothetical protein [Myxococcota bacterium]